MSGTITQFAPSATVPFQFQANLANATGVAAYNCTALWNTYGQRWYLQIVDQNGTLILNEPLIASPAGYDISLCRGMFTSRFVFLEATQQFVVVT